MAGYLKTEAVAELFGISPQTLAKWRHLGKGPSYVKLGSRVRYSPSDLNEFLKSHAVDPDEES